MTEDVRYRRGNLREALLARAFTVLRERGIGALSLRELARDVGVSHMAPARHFADREALLEALSVEGFQQLGNRLRIAGAAGGALADRARLIGREYVRFAVEDANLLGVMYQHDSNADRGAVGRSAEAAFTPLARVFEQAEQAGTVTRGTAASGATLFLATLQGIAALMHCGVLQSGDGGALVDDAVPRYLIAPAGERAAAGAATPR